MTDALPWPATLAPRLKLAGRFPLADRGFSTTYLGPTHALHLHDYPGRMRLGERLIELEPGDLTLSPAGVPSAYHLPEPGRHWCVHFHPADAGEPAVGLPTHLRLGAAAAYARERLAAVSRLQARALAKPGDLLAAASAAVAFQELLLWCVARASAPPGDDVVADKVAAFVETAFAEPLSAGRIARHVGRSPNYVARLFRQRFGMTIPRYVLQRRMAHARHLLETTDLPVARIAERVGVPDPQYFNKLARRFMGASPTAIRAAAQGGASPAALR